MNKPAWVEPNRWYVCNICELDIPPMMPNNHNLQLSLDHEIPKSMGGKGLPNNRKPAHRYCNSSRKSTDINIRLKQRLQNYIDNQLLELIKTNKVPNILLNTSPECGTIIVGQDEDAITYWLCIACGCKAPTNIIKHSANCSEQKHWKAIELLRQVIEQ